MPLSTRRQSHPASLPRRLAPLAVGPFGALVFRGAPRSVPCSTRNATSRRLSAVDMWIASACVLHYGIASLRHSAPM